jgi:hypothetical protein
MTITKQLSKLCLVSLSACLLMSTLSCGSVTDPNSELDADKGIFKKFKKTVSKTANTVSNTATSTANTVSNTATSTANTVANTVTDTVNTATSDETMADAADLLNKSVSATSEFVMQTLTSQGLANYCNSVEFGARFFFKLYYNPIELCSPKSEGDGYFMFGTKGGTGFFPIFQHTVYSTYSTNNSQKFKIALQDEPVGILDFVMENGKTIVKISNFTDADAFNKYAQAMGMSKEDLPTMLTELYQLVGPFGVSASYNYKTTQFNIYVSKKDGTTSLLNNAVFKKIENFREKFSASKILPEFYEGPEIKDTMDSGFGNSVIFFYLFGTNRVTYSHE